jgi:hypothetical protein
MKTAETFDITQKTRIYHTIAQLTSSFSSIMRYCEELEQAGALTAKYRRLYQAFTVEIQAQLNSDILEYMDSIEMDDWNRSGRVRDKWEKYLRFEGEKPAGKKKAPHKEEKPTPRKRAGSAAK